MLKYSLYNNKLIKYNFLRCFSSKIELNAHEIFSRLIENQDNIAITSPNVANITYNQMLHESYDLSLKIKTFNENNKFINKKNTNQKLMDKILNNPDNLNVDRIAFMMPSDHNYCHSMFGIWLDDSICVPIHHTYPKKQIEYILNDIKPKLIICHPKFQENINNANKLNIPTLIYEKNQDNLMKYKEINNDSIIYTFNQDQHTPALIVYTSGTTNQPKGVVLTHHNLENMIKSLSITWEYNNNDRILHFLPLHHLHGILNKLLCIFWNGGSVEFLEKNDPLSIWKRIAESGNNTKEDITLFMAVPTIYHRMLDEFNNLDDITKKNALNGCKKMRLMISGSSPLSTMTLYEWENLTGHRLLERYGMTELGMVLSNPIDGKRHPGYVGNVLPNIEIRVVNPDTDLDIDGEEAGELRVKSPNVFEAYWNLPKETEDSFDDQNYFKTGDIVSWNNELQSFKILGRENIDIIKSKGYKISALEIERELINHPLINEVQVVGVKDEDEGEKIIAFLTLKNINNNNNNIIINNQFNDNNINYKSIQNSLNEIIQKILSGKSSLDKSIDYYSNFRKKNLWITATAFTSFLCFNPSFGSTEILGSMISGGVMLSITSILAFFSLRRANDSSTSILDTINSLKTYFDVTFLDKKEKNKREKNNDINDKNNNDINDKNNNDINDKNNDIIYPTFITTHLPNFLKTQDNIINQNGTKAILSSTRVSTLLMSISPTLAGTQGLVSNTLIMSVLGLISLGLTSSHGMYTLITPTLLSITGAATSLHSYLQSTSVLNILESTKHELELSQLLWNKTSNDILKISSNQNNEKFEVDDLNDWLKPRLPQYKIPSLYHIMDNFPKSPIGKVNKKELIQLYEKYISNDI